MICEVCEGDDVEPRLIICQGPPCCDLTGDEAVAAQPCMWCRIETYHEDRTVSVQEPSRA